MMTGLFVVGFLISILGIIIYFSRESAIKQVQPDNNDETITQSYPSEYTGSPESVTFAKMSVEKAFANSESVRKNKKAKSNPSSPLTTIHSQSSSAVYYHDDTQEYYPVPNQNVAFPVISPLSEPVLPINDWSSWASSSNNASDASVSGASSGFDSSSSSSSSYDSSSSSSYDSGSSSSGGDW